MKRISLGLIAMITGVLLSSFIGKENKQISSDENNWKEYRAVNSFVYKTVCEPIRVASPKSKMSVNKFSRCASGFTPEITTKEEDVKKENFVYGTIQEYKGCSPTYVCDFKVCVDKGVALVKSKNSDNYVTVNEWLVAKKKQQQQKDIVLKSL